MIIGENLWSVTGMKFYKNELAPTSPTTKRALFFLLLMNYYYLVLLCLLISIEPFAKL